MPTLVARKVELTSKQKKKMLELHNRVVALSDRNSLQDPGEREASRKLDEVERQMRKCTDDALLKKLERRAGLLSVEVEQRKDTRLREVDEAAQAIRRSRRALEHEDDIPKSVTSGVINTERRLPPQIKQLLLS